MTSKQQKYQKKNHNRVIRIAEIDGNTVKIYQLDSHEMIKDFKHPKVMHLKQYLQEIHDKEIELELSNENEFHVPEKEEEEEEESISDDILGIQSPKTEIQK